MATMTMNDDVMQKIATIKIAAFVDELVKIAADTGSPGYLGGFVEYLTPEHEEILKEAGLGQWLGAAKSGLQAAGGAIAGAGQKAMGAIQNMGAGGAARRMAAVANQGAVAPASAANLMKPMTHHPVSGLPLPGGGIQNMNINPSPQALNASRDMEQHLLRTMGGNGPMPTMTPSGGNIPHPMAAGGSAPRGIEHLRPMSTYTPQINPANRPQGPAGLLKASPRDTAAMQSMMASSDARDTSAMQSMLNRPRAIPAMGAPAAPQAIPAMANAA